ncbi:MAG: hypothetical protein RBR14_06425 [Candidatus Cloacimonas acidaminovorans]|nr:hypothetical protein [Candidatus Cloacimonas acidaminovorans]
MVKIDEKGYVTEEYQRAVLSALKAKGIKEKDFAILLGIPAGVFYQWICGYGKYKKLRDNLIKKIEAILNV